MTAPTAADIAAFLGQGDDDSTVALAGQVLPIITAMAMAYTRDQGFDTTGDPADDVAAVITTATARLMQNPAQLAYTNGETTIQGGFTGWTLAEAFVLNRYRKRAI